MKKKISELSVAKINCPNIDFSRHRMKKKLISTSTTVFFTSIPSNAHNDWKAIALYLWAGNSPFFVILSIEPFCGRRREN